MDTSTKVLGFFVLAGIIFQLLMPIIGKFVEKQRVKELAKKRAQLIEDEFNKQVGEKQ